MIKKLSGEFKLGILLCLLIVVFQALAGVLKWQWADTVAFVIFWAFILFILFLFIKGIYNWITGKL